MQIPLDWTGGRGWRESGFKRLFLGSSKLTDDDQRYCFPDRIGAVGTDELSLWRQAGYIGVGKTE